MSLQITVDADNLWFILRQYRCRLNMACPKNKELADWVDNGFYSGEYKIIDQMEEQIKGIL